MLRPILVSDLACLYKFELNQTGLIGRETYYSQELSQHKHEIRLDDDIWGFG